MCCLIGKVCRSPIGEFVLKKMVSDLGVAEQFYIASAATSTEEIWNGVGNPVYPPAKAELARHGISCEGKRAVQVTRQDYQKYDYLICMDSHNIRNLMWIIGADPENKVSLLLDYTDRPGESIADPWYTGAFDVTYRDVVEGCEGLLKHLGFKEISEIVDQ